MIWIYLWKILKTSMFSWLSLPHNHFWKYTFLLQHMAAFACFCVWICLRVGYQTHWPGLVRAALTCWTPRPLRTALTAMCKHLSLSSDARSCMIIWILKIQMASWDSVPWRAYLHHPPGSSFQEESFFSWAYTQNSSVTKIGCKPNGKCVHKI